MSNSKLKLVKEFLSIGKAENAAVNSYTPRLELLNESIDENTFDLLLNGSAVLLVGRIVDTTGKLLKAYNKNSKTWE